MTKMIRLIWDFRGPDALKIAEHHAIHLREYARAHDLIDNPIGTNGESELHSIAYFVVSEDLMPQVRDTLKPNRGDLYSKPLND